jgi:hypothetical protein
MTETTPVRPGQIWADNDYRAAGRTLRVDEVVGLPAGDQVAVCMILTNPTKTQDRLDRAGGRDAWVRDMRGKTTRIKVRRMRLTNTGYRLLGNATEGEER